jgi:quercetin dioxygenase-like cupin family protein
MSRGDRTVIRLAQSVSVAAFACLLALPAAAQEAPAQYQNLLTPLLEGNQTTVGQPILAYPDGTPHLTAAIVTIPPGGDTGWHIHEVPLFIYILDGEVTVDYGQGVVKVYKPGDSFMEAMNRPHDGINKSDAPVRILAFYVGAEGVPDAEEAPAPQ